MLIGAFEAPYDDTRSARESLHKFSSFLIARYLAALTLAPHDSTKDAVTIEDASRAEVLMLKELTWQFVIDNPAMAIAQHGQREIIERLFMTYASAAEKEEYWALFPKAWNERIQHDTTSAARLRTVADFISSLTERQALRLAARLAGSQIGTLLEAPGIL